MLQEARAASESFARAGNVTVSWERLWNIEPVPFHPELLALSDPASAEPARPSTVSPPVPSTTRPRLPVLGSLRS